MRSTFVFTSVMRAPHTSNFNCHTDMVSSQMRESLALDNGCTLAAYPCRPAAVRGIRARVVSFNNIHQSDNAFVVAAMYWRVSESAAWSDQDRSGRTASSACSREHRVP